MDSTQFWTLLSKVTNVEGQQVPTIDAKLSKLFENKAVSSFLNSSDSKAVESTSKILDEISVTFSDEKLAAKRDSQLHKLNKELLTRVFVFGDSLSSFDLIYYALLHSWMSKLTDKERFVFVNITRWFNFIQHQKSIQGVLPNIIISQTPPPAEPKKDDKKQAADKKPDANNTTTPQGGEKKPAAEGKKQQQAKPKEEPKPEDISRFEIRVGQIVACKKHENADSLYVESIDLGEEKPRQIVSGLVKFIPLDEMINRRVLVLCNLKPSNLKSVRSEGMVLCASNDDHTKVEFIEPPAGAVIGERVVFENYKGDFDKVLKKETLDVVLDNLKSNDNKIATYKGDEWKTSAGSCYCKTLSNALIK